MIDAVLLDLDETLLDLDTDDFLKRYFKKLGEHLAPFVDRETFADNLWASTGAMVYSTDPDLTNREAFIRHFSTWVQHPQEVVWPCIDEFYDKVFPALQGNAGPFPGVPEVIEKLRKEGKTLVLATNPIFPLSAIAHRIAWAGLSIDDFSLVTSYEKMHFCKPNPRYFLEISEMINIAPEKCLMAGNDPELDIKGAAEANMKTYLVDNSLPAVEAEKGRGPVSGILDYLDYLKEQK